MTSIGPDIWLNSISLRCGNELSHFLSISGTLIMVLSISRASVLNLGRNPVHKFKSSHVYCATALTSLLELLLNHFFLSFHPIQDPLQTVRITGVPAPLSIKIFPSRTLPFGALNLALTTGIILAMSKTEATPGCAAFTGIMLPTGGWSIIGRDENTDKSHSFRISSLICNHSLSVLDLNTKNTVLLSLLALIVLEQRLSLSLGIRQHDGLLHIHSTLLTISLNHGGWPNCLFSFWGILESLCRSPKSGLNSAFTLFFTNSVMGWIVGV